MEAPLDPLSILANTGRLRQLARTLVRDEHLAEDLVQDTWLACLRRPPDEPRALSAWLSRVLRNLASSSRRRDTARLRRELARAEPELDSSSSGESLERFETLKAVVEMVAELEEPGRSSVILHFFDGLTLAQVADRQKVSVGAVRLRLKVALDKLRARLDRRFGGRRSWVLTLTPLLAPLDLAALEASGAAAPAHGAAVVKAMGGALSMSIQKISLVLAASILLFLGVAGSWLALRPTGGRLPEGRSGAVAGLAEKDPRGAAGDAKDPGASGDVVAVDAVPRGSGAIAIEGRVTGDGAGLRGARVIAISLSRWEAAAGGLREERHDEHAFVRLGEALRREASSSPEERTGREGGFIFRGLGDGSYRLLVTHPERLPSVETIVSVAAGAPARCEIELAAASFIEGEVRDEAGRPVADAVIEAEAAETAQLRGMARDLRRSVAWSDASMLVAPPAAMSDAAGTFRLGPIQPAPHALRASHPAFLRAELIAAPGGGRLTITLGRGAAIVGRVLGKEGPLSARARASRETASEAHLVFDWSGSDREPAPEGPREAHAAADGKFRIEGLDAGLHVLEISAPGLAVLHREIEVRDDVEDLGDLQLEAPLRIAGRVLDPSRKPVEGARVTAGQARRAHHAGNAIAPPGPPPMAEAKSDARGRFVLGGLPAGLFQVEAGAEGFARALASGVSSGEAALDLVLEEGLTVHGKVIDAGTLDPVAGAEVELALAGRWKAASDSRGLFVLRGYPRVEGRYGANVVAKHPEYGIYSEHSVSVMGRTASSPLEIRLDRSGHEIRGRILDGAGRPVASAQVWVEPAGESGSYSTPGDRAASGEDGSFRLPEPFWLRYAMDRPPVVIGALHPSHAMGWAGPFLGPSTGRAWPEMEIVLSEGVSLEGTVTGMDGRPIAGARVAVGRSSGGGRERRLGGILGTRSSFTDANGNYRLHRLTPGEAEAAVQALGWAPARVAIDLGPGTGRRDFVLDRGSPIRGRVVDAGGAPLDGVEVAAVEEGAAPPEAPTAFGSRMDLRARAGVASARTGAGGRYEIQHLAQGSYTVIARARGHEAAEAKGVAAGEEAPDIVLARFSALRGVVLGSDGAPVTAFKVDLIDRAHRAEQEERADWRVGSQGEIGFADVEGRFFYDGLRAGEYDVVVMAPGYLAFHGEARLEAGEEAEFEARLARGSRLIGVLSDAATGRPVADAMVVCTRQLSKRELEALNEKKGTLRLPMSPPSASGHTWSGDGGEWILDGLLDGDYGIWVTHPLYLKGSGRVEIGPGGTERLDLALEPCGRLEGALVGLGGGPPLEPGIEMHYSIDVELLGASREEARQARANGEWSFPVNRSGRFQAQGLRPGTYRLSVTTRPYRQGRFEETGPGWGNSRPEPAGPERRASLGEVEIRAGETARLHAKVPEGSE